MKAEDIAAQLRREIVDGELRPGDLVPSARAIRSRWQVALATASRVHALLRADGLVQSQPGVGVVVVERSAAQPPARLQVGVLVATAVTIADHEGMEAVSFRRLGTELAAAPMSLHRLAASKDELVTAMLETVLGEWQPPRIDAGTDWRERVEAGCRGMWGVLRRHPWAGGAITLNRPQVLVAGIGWTEWHLAAPCDGGFDIEEAFDVHLAMFSFVRSLAIALEADIVAEAATGVDADEWVADRLPALRALATAGPYFARLADRDYEFTVDRLFDTGLRLMLDGLPTDRADPGAAR